MEMTLASGNPGTLLVTVTLARRRVLLTASTVGSTLSFDARVYVRDTRRYVAGYIGCRHGSVDLQPTKTRRRSWNIIYLEQIFHESHPLTGMAIKSEDVLVSTFSVSLWCSLNPYKNWRKGFVQVARFYWRGAKSLRCQITASYRVRVCIKYPNQR